MRRWAIGIGLLAGVWLILLLVFPIYVEPANGSLGCVPLWQRVPPDHEVRELCVQAVRERRSQLWIPMVLVTVAGAAFAASVLRDRSADRPTARERDAA